MEPLLIFGGFAVLLVGVIVLAFWVDKKRTEAWQRTAEELNYEFLGKIRPEQLPNIGLFRIFGKGRNRTAKNVIRGSEGALQVTLCDYSFRTGGGKNSSTHNQTVCLVDDPEMAVPGCFLRPEIRLFDFLGKVFGGQDINFDEDPDFSKAYVLQGDDEGDVRVLFDQELRDFFVRNRKKNWQFEARGNGVCFHNGRTIKPETAAELVADALEIVSLLRR